MSVRQREHEARQQNCADSTLKPGSDSIYERNRSPNNSIGLPRRAAAELRF